MRPFGSEFAITWCIRFMCIQSRVYNLVSRIRTIIGHGNELVAVMAGVIRIRKWPLSKVFVDFNGQYVRSGHYVRCAIFLSFSETNGPSRNRRMKVPQRASRARGDEESGQRELKFCGNGSRPDQAPPARRRSHVFGRGVGEKRSPSLSRHENILRNLLRSPNWLLGSWFRRSGYWLGYHNRVGDRLRNVDRFRAGLMSTNHVRPS